MHLGPTEARAWVATFLARHAPQSGRSIAVFPPAVSLEAVAAATRSRSDLATGVQDIYWEPKGPFTGAVSAPLAAQAGASIALVGHSERRHLFGETDAETARKVRAALGSGLTALLCVGERLEEREATRTIEVVTRQLTAALDGLEPSELGRVVVAYEPVWAIGTGRNATPHDAAEVHRTIRKWLAARDAPAPRILYGGSVNLKNAAALLAETELDGVLVGGASLEPDGWAQLVQTAVP